MQKQEKKQAKCVIYSRVSDPRQVKEGRSLGDQITMCKRFAEENNYKVVGIFQDDGKTGRNSRRDALQDMILKCIDDKEITGAIVAETDRFFRNVQEHLNVKAVLRKYGTRLLSVNQPMLNVDSPEGKFTDTIIAGVNEFLSEITARKVFNSMREKFLEGWYPKEPPLGYTNINIGTEEKPIRIIGDDEFRQKLIKMGFEMFASGLYSSVEKVNEILNKKGLVNRNGKKVSSKQFGRILQNTFYYGWMQWGGEKIMGNHTHIISKTLFDQCQKVFEEHNHRANRERKHNFLLRGFVYCGVCRGRMTAEHHQPKAKSYYHCCSGKHSNKGQNMAVDELEKRIGTLFKQIQLPKSLVTKILDKAKEILDKTHQEIDTDKRLLASRKSQLETEKSKLERKLLEFSTSDDAGQFKRFYPLAEKRIEEIENEVKNIEKQDSELLYDRESNIRVFKRLILLAKDVGLAYEKAPSEVKQHYLGLFWDKIEVADCQIKKAVPTKIYRELFPKYDFAISDNKLSNKKVITNDDWRAWRESNPRHRA